MRFSCDYQVPKVSSIDSRGLAPRDLKGLAPKTSAPQSISLSNYKFASQAEYLSFTMFCERTMFDLVGAGDSDLWTRIVVQASESQDAIRNAVMAIGALVNALDVARKSGNPFLMHTADLDLTICGRHHFALEKYGNAIRQMRRDMEDEKYDLRTTIISCILVVCFELFEGNHGAARIHASSGLGLIGKLAGETQDGKLGSGGQDVDESLVDILLRLDQLSNPFALNSVMGTWDNISLHDGLSLTGFTTCKEARRAWKITVWNISKHLWSRHQKYSSLTGSADRRAHEYAFTDEQWRSKVWDVDLAFTRMTGDQQHPDYELEQLLQWYTAFKPLYQQSLRSKDVQLRCQVAVLQIRHHNTFIALSSAQKDNETQYDQFTPLFAEILNLSQELLEAHVSSGNNRPIFTFNIGISGSLWVVATKCRHSELRWRALRLLLEYPRREGLWDSAVVGNGAEKLIRLEEEGVVNAIVPEQARVRAEGVSFQLAIRIAKLSYSRHPGLGAPEPEKRIMEAVEVSW